MDLKMIVVRIELSCVLSPALTVRKTSHVDLKIIVVMIELSIVLSPALTVRQVMWT